MQILVGKTCNSVDIIDVGPDFWIKLSVWTVLPICNDACACEADQERGTGTTQQASYVGFKTRNVLRFTTV